MHIHWLYARKNKETVGESWNFSLFRQGWSGCSRMNSENQHKGDQGHHWKEKKIWINQFMEALMCCFFIYLFFCQYDLLCYISGPLVHLWWRCPGWKQGCLFFCGVFLETDACFASTLFNCVPMNHISRITGLLPLFLYANIEMIYSQMEQQFF